MKSHFKDLLIFGGELDGIAGCTNAVKEGDEFELNGLKFHCYHVPCHTKGHILFLID